MIPRWQRRAMELAIKRARFEKAGFWKIAPRENEKLPATEAEVDAFIRDRTQLYIETWLIPLLEAVRDGDRKAAEALL